VKTILKNIAGHGLNQKSIAITGESKTHAYHIWIDPDTLKPHDNILHRNPLSGQPGGHKGLNQHALVNQPIVTQLLREAAVAIVETRARVADKEIRERQEVRKREREQRIRDAAPKLLLALETLCACFDEEGHLDQIFEDQVSIALEDAQDAIKDVRQSHDNARAR
jgi:hypothetical protein